jgi:CRISPR/Cas system-associated exonuclease Cas4 (RecB family)
MIKGFRCSCGEAVPFAVCLERARTHPDDCPFVYPILKGMVNGIGIRGEVEGISVTTMLSCLRKSALERRHDAYVDPKQLYHAFRGQLFHALAELGRPEGCIVEKRFARTIAGLTISGQPDLIWPEHRLLIDFKSTRRRPPREPYPHHALQVNLYRWLIEPVHEVDRLEIVYMDMDGARRLPVPLMEPRKVTATLVARARSLGGALNGGELPSRAGPDGLWQCSWCPFPARCWPEGIPTADELRRRQEFRLEAISRARSKTGPDG